MHVVRSAVSAAQPVNAPRDHAAGAEARLVERRWLMSRLPAGSESA
jgi:hypothetical protein